MRLIYFVNARIPTEKAYGFAISKICEKFANLGYEVVLVLPKYRKKDKEDIYKYYGIKNNFKIKKVFNINLIGKFEFFHKFFFLLQNFSFLISSLFVKIKKDDLIYLRNIEGLLFWPWKTKNVFLEIHFLSKKDKFFLFLIKRAKKIIVITRKLKDRLIDYGISEKKILVVPDGVDLEEFSIKESQKECRLKLDLPLDKKIILYNGNMYPWKGAHILAEAGKYLDNNYQIVFVGGSEYEIKEFRSKFSDQENISIVGYKHHWQMPYWLKAADIFSLPNSGKEDISKYWTSPLKMFEFMAVKRPIIASNLPSLREILNKKNSFLVKPDNPEEIAKAIKFLLNNSDFSANLSEQAFNDVKKYTWLGRADKIIKFIKER